MDLTSGLIVTVGPLLLFALTLWVGKINARNYIKKHMPDLLQHYNKK